jgi:hypothetical protein
VGFFLYLAATFVTVRALIREARSRYRWPTRPTRSLNDPIDGFS